jgi:hypothetical protein
MQDANLQFSDKIEKGICKSLLRPWKSYRFCTGDGTSRF